MITELPFSGLIQTVMSPVTVRASRAATTAPASALKVGPITAPLGANLSIVCERGSVNCLQALETWILNEIRDFLGRGTFG